MSMIIPRAHDNLLDFFAAWPILGKLNQITILQKVPNHAVLSRRNGGHSQVTREFFRGSLKRRHPELDTQEAFDDFRKLQIELLQ